VIASPDPCGKQIDGMSGTTSSTSKVVILSKSDHPDCDADDLFGAVAIDAPVISCSGNCGNLSDAVGPFAIGEGDGTATVRICQANIGNCIIADLPMRDGEIREDGDFKLDDVTCRDPT
jgi:hypothetical protein